MTNSDSRRAHRGAAAALRAFAFSLPASLLLAASPPSIAGNPNGDAFNMGAVSVEVSENAGSVTVTVLRQGVGAGPASVDYGTQDVTAVAPRDYTAVSGTLTWADGDLTPQTVTIPIIDNTTDDNDRVFSFGLTNPQNAGIGVFPSEAIVILDDDVAPPAPVSAPTLGAIGRLFLGALLALGAWGAVRRQRIR